MDPITRRKFRVPEITPIDTDWNDIHEIWADMHEFSKDHPGLTVTCANDSGSSHDPPRVPRLGWVAYIDNPDTPLKTWTITIRKLRRTLKSKPMPDETRQAMLRGLLDIKP